MLGYVGVNGAKYINGKFYFRNPDGRGDERQTK
jgi:hypothetical protein